MELSTQIEKLTVENCFYLLFLGRFASLMLSLLQNVVLANLITKIYNLC